MLDGLEQAVRGRVVRRGAADYDAARRAAVWNGRKPARQPDAIVQVADAADVQAAVAYATAHDLRIALRNGGHNWSGLSLRDGGLLLDLQALNGLAIDAPRRVATVGPAVRGLALAEALAPHGLAFPVGHCSSVALGGFLLGGGFGWNAGAWGVGCFNVRAVDVVLADGRLVRADAEHEPDLFWAARGAGAGFFGVVTRFELDLHPLPTVIRSSLLSFPLAQLDALVGWVRSLVPALPPWVELTLMIGRPPGVVSARHEPVCSVSVAVFADTPQQAAAALAPLADCPIAPRLACVLDVPSSFAALFAGMDELYVAGRRYQVDTLWSDADPAAVLATVGAHVAASPGADNLVLALLLPPPPAAAPPLPDAAFSMVAPLYLGCYAVWDDAVHDAAHLAWSRDLMRALEPHGVGHYLGEADLTAAQRAERSFGAAQWQRLQALRRRYDPQRRLHGFPGAE
ncbi:MAG: FAD-binding oxidoreductase [Deltaproteobacteria bacterium]|nr:FAD-binding oxidoreductase [Deltaproteobacteria bacterium]